MNMFGRNSQNAYSSGNYSSGTYGNSGYNAPSSQSLYRQQSTYQKIGSYRILDYDSQKLFGGIAKAQQYKDYTPISISLRDETFHLSPIQTRVEDYYSIRTKNIEDKHRRSVESCINKKVFNPDLISNDSMASLKPVASTAEGGLGPDAVQKVCNRVVSRYGNNESPFAGRSNNSGGYSSSTNNPFSTSNPTNRMNPFTSNQSSNNANNPFSSNNNNNSNNSTNNNMFASRNNSGNPFSSNNNTGNGNGSGGNPFTNNNNNSGNPFSNNSGGGGGMYGSTRYGNNSGSNNNPFSSNNNSGNRQGSNMFNNSNNPFNNSNSSNNNNPFNNNNSNNNNPFNNNSSNNNNPFNNNNSNSRNPFSSNNNNTSNNLFNNNNNNYNNNNSNNNNMFSTNNNNNRGGNNLFNNGGNYSGGNNLFNNGTNNNNGMFNNGEMMQFAMLQMMREIADKFVGNSGNGNMGVNTGYNGSYLDHNAADREYYQASERIQKKYAQWFRDPFENDDAISYKRKPKKSDNRTIVIVKQQSQKLPNTYPSIQGSFIKNSTTLNNQQDPFNPQSHQNDSISASQYHKFYTSKNASFSPSPANNEAQMLNNQNQVKRTTSTFMMDYNQGRSNSVYGTVPGKGNMESMEASFIRGKVNISQIQGIRYWYKVCCMWSESFRKNYVTRDQFYVQGEVIVQNQPSQAQLTDLILTQILCQTSQKKIRRNASLTLQYPIPFTSSPSPSSSSSPKQFKIQGTLIHDKINLRKGYDYIYDSIDRWHVTNLTISCKYGCVQWRGQTVYIEQVDFQNQIVFDQEGVFLDGVLEEEYDKNVTLNWLPKSVQGELPDQGKARAVMEYEIKRARKKSKNQGIRLIQIDFQKNFYTVKIPKFKTPPQQTPQN